MKGLSSRMNFLLFLWGNRKTFIYVGIAATVVSVVISFLMTPLYLSTALIFPSASSNVPLSQQHNYKASSIDIGGETQAEHLIQVMESSRMRDRIVEEFDLMKHYEIEDDENHRQYKLIKEYSQHIGFSRTRYGSVRIAVYDREPELSAKIANRIVDLVDTVKNDMIRERTAVAFQISKRKMEQLLKEKEDISARLDSLASLGVLPREVRPDLYRAVVETSGSEKVELMRIIDVNQKLGPSFDGLMHARDQKDGSIESFKEAYEQTESDFNANYSHKFVVELAIVPDKKEWPKRLVVVIMGVIGTLVFTVFALLLRERLKELKEAKAE